MAKGKRLTQEEFLSRVTDIFKDRLDFSKAVYQSSQKKVLVICPEHGEIWNQPCELLRGRGCWKCGKVSSAKAKTTTTEDFIRKSVELYGENVLDYSSANVHGVHTKVTLRCVKHNVTYEQAPSVHLRGIFGCPCCMDEAAGERVKGRTKTTAEFVQQAREVHGDKYDYTRTRYVTIDHHKVVIVCPIHGEFQTMPYSHLRGHGCPSCASYGFDPAAQAVLYVIECKSKSYDFTGYGITRDKETRLSMHRRTLSDRGFGVCNIRLFDFSTGASAREVETAISSRFSTSPTADQAAIKGFKRENTSAPFEEVVAFVQKYLENREGS